MIKIIFFDLDNTLAPVGKPTADEDVMRLKRLYASGVRIAVCSGKPVSYLNGYARQLGINDIIIIGENGVTYQFGLALPPEISGEISYPEETGENLNRIKEEFDRLFTGKYWYQKNEHSFTPFPYKDEYFPAMYEYFERTIPGTGLVIYAQPDCFDVLPSGISKGVAVKAVCSLLKTDLCDTASVGDSKNDYPMFEVTGLSIGIKLKDSSKADINVKSLSEALDYLYKEIKNERKL
jgi:HAD superfamily hydrolase (TIGR01484 family)